MPPAELEWQRVAELFHAAREMSPSLRDAWLDAQTGGEAATRDEVRSLLAAERKHEGLSAQAACTPAEPPPPPARLSERFGPYKTERLLGQGGMGAVYLARRVDGQFDQVVALKVMAAQLADAEFLKRFHTERQVLASLNHANITRLLDGGVSSAGDPYLVMEYVDGVPLDRYCDDLKLGVEARLNLFLDVCEAVDFAHRSLILHRDLKPGNILVTAESTVKLLDFGTASLMAADASVTGMDTRMLTPRYASPEQMRGERSAVAGDVFSLGVVLYELLTGAWPFGTPGSVISALQRIKGDAAPTRPAAAITDRAAGLRSASPDRLRRLLAGDLSAIVLKALEHDPSRRFGSVRQLVDDLGNFLNGLPVLARKQTAVYRAGKFLRRHLVAAGTAAAFVIAVTVAGIVAVHEARTARAEALKSEQVSLFLTDMLSSAGRFSFDPQKYTVLQMLEAADGRLEKGPKGDPATEAVLRRSLASSYYALHRNDRATFHLDRAIATFRAMDDTPELAEALRMRSLVSENQGQYDAAAAFLEEALMLVQRLGVDASPVTVFRIKSALAQTFSFNMNRHLDRARGLYQEAIGLANRDPAIPRIELAATMAKWGGLLLEEGKDREAEAVLMGALETGRSDNPGGLWEFDPLYELSVIRGRRNDQAGAKEAARQMVDVSVRAVGVDSSNTAQATMTWARYAAQTGELPAAVSGVLQAMPIIERSYPSPSLVLWHSARNAARVMRLAGRYAEAERYARESLAVALAAKLPAADPRTANSWDELGQTLCDKRQFPEGIRALEQAEAIYIQAGGTWLEHAATKRRQISEWRRQADSSR